MIQLKEDQWYQLPSSRWVRAICTTYPPSDLYLGPILVVYGVDVGGSAGYGSIGDMYIYPDGTLTATGTYTWDTWTLADLREATPDEAEEQTRRVLGFSDHSG